MRMQLQSRALWFVGGPLISVILNYILTYYPPANVDLKKMRLAAGSRDDTQKPLSGHHWSSPRIPIRFVTHNIRYATGYPFEGELPWADRLPLLLSELTFLSQGPGSVFICLQEVLHRQLVDILEGLNGRPSQSKLHSRSEGDDSFGRVETEEQVEDGDDVEWAYIGVGRSDGKTKGEYSPVIYRKKQFRCVGWRTTWLSETPSIPSKGWDAANTRILTHGTFETLSPFYPTTRLVVMSTHLDHIGREARRKSARLILKHISFYSPLPVVIGGDFNSPPEDDAYKLVTSRPELVGDLRVLIRERYSSQPSTCSTASQAQDHQDGNVEPGDGAEKEKGEPMDHGRRPKTVFGDHHTFTGFKKETEKAIIDFLFLGPWEDGENKNGTNNPWTVKGYSVIPNKFEDGVYVSDHRAVVGDLELNV